MITLPESNSSPLKTCHPKKKLVFQPSTFRGELLVSFRVYCWWLKSEKTWKNTAPENGPSFEDVSPIPSCAMGWQLLHQGCDPTYIKFQSYPRASQRFGSWFLRGPFWEERIPNSWKPRFFLIFQGSMVLFQGGNYHFCQENWSETLGLLQIFSQLWP